MDGQRPPCVALGPRCYGAIPPTPTLRPQQPNERWGLLMSWKGREREVVLSGSPSGWRAGVGGPPCWMLPPRLKAAPGPRPRETFPEPPPGTHRLLQPGPPSVAPGVVPSGARAHKGLLGPSGSRESLVGPRRSLGLPASRGEGVTKGAPQGSRWGGEGRVAGAPSPSSRPPWSRPARGVRGSSPGSRARPPR